MEEFLIMAAESAPTLAGLIVLVVAIFRYTEKHINRLTQENDRLRRHNDQLLDWCQRCDDNRVPREPADEP